MLIATGDLWSVPADLRVVTTNGVVTRAGRCVMGRGSALQARDRYPGVDLLLGSYIERYGNRVFRLAPDLASFPVKHDWRQPADPTLIARSARQLVSLVDRFGYRSVVLPRPGCGAGQLRWPTVQPLIAPVLDDRFTVVTL